MIARKDDVQALLIGDQIAQIVAQTSRQSGFRSYIPELFNFSGDEIYFQAEQTDRKDLWRSAHWPMKTLLSWPAILQMRGQNSIHP